MQFGVISVQWSGLKRAYVKRYNLYTSLIFPLDVEPDRPNVRFMRHSSSFCRLFYFRMTVNKHANFSNVSQVSELTSIAILARHHISWANFSSTSSSSPHTPQLTSRLHSCVCAVKSPQDDIIVMQSSIYAFCTVG